MDTRNRHLESGKGRLAASDGTATEMSYEAERFDGNMGSANWPIWTPWTIIQELDFRRSSVPEATMKVKGQLKWNSPLPWREVNHL